MKNLLDDAGDALGWKVEQIPPIEDSELMMMMMMAQMPSPYLLDLLVLLKVLRKHII